MSLSSRIFPRHQPATRETAKPRPSARSAAPPRDGVGRPFLLAPLSASSSGQYTVAQQQASEPRPAFGTSRGSRMKIVP